MKNPAASSGVSFNGKSFIGIALPNPCTPFITAASGQRAAGLLATLLRPKPYSGFFRINLPGECNAKND
jgi:hypothetical protein